LPQGSLQDRQKVLLQVLVVVKLTVVCCDCLLSLLFLGLSLLDAVDLAASELLHLLDTLDEKIDVLQVIEKSDSNHKAATVFDLRSKATVDIHLVRTGEVNFVSEVVVGIQNHSPERVYFVYAG
jgi:Co/Zn/Cd efflux system component